MVRYGEGFFKHVLLFMFTSSLVLQHFVNPKLTELHWNIYLQFILYVMSFWFSAFGNVTTDVPEPLDTLIHSVFFSCTFWTKQYFSSYTLLWKRTIQQSRDLRNRLESVRDLLIFDQLISWLHSWYWLHMANFVLNKYI